MLFRSVQQLVPKEQLLGFGRLVVFGVGLILAWLVFGAKWISPWWLAAPVVVFVVLLLGITRFDLPGWCLPVGLIAAGVALKAWEKSASS